MARKTVPPLIAGTLGAVLAGPAGGENASHHWSYSGKEAPAHWGELDSSWRTCAIGHHQSPIDIRNADAKIQPLPPLKFDYRPTTLHIVDNGHSIQVNVDHGSSLTVGSDRYELIQFHFHHPSEERIDGRGRDMSVHFVHRDRKGRLAIVAVLLTAGHENSLIERLWRSRPPAGHEKIVKNVVIDPTALIPANLSYFSYSGSLTTPPCSEEVRWFVLKTPVSVSSKEIATFAAEYPNNARPVQPLNGRSVLSSK